MLNIEGLHLKVAMRELKNLCIDNFQKISK